MIITWAKSQNWTSQGNPTERCFLSTHHPSFIVHWCSWSTELLVHSGCRIGLDSIPFLLNLHPPGSLVALLCCNRVWQVYIIFRTHSCLLLMLKLLAEHCNPRWSNVYSLIPHLVEDHFALLSRFITLPTWVLPAMITSYIDENMTNSWIYKKPCATDNCKWKEGTEVNYLKYNESLYMTKRYQ
jgi:hypothetical protein